MVQRQQETRWVCVTITVTARAASHDKTYSICSFSFRFFILTLSTKRSPKYAIKASLFPSEYRLHFTVESYILGTFQMPRTLLCLRGEWVTSEPSPDFVGLQKYSDTHYENMDKLVLKLYPTLLVSQRLHATYLREVSERYTNCFYW